MYESGNSIGVIADGGKLIQQLKELELQKVNEFLKGKNRQPLQVMLFESRLDLDRPNVNAKIPAPTHKEVLYLAHGIKDRVREIEDNYRQHPVGKGEVSAPEKYDDYEKLFWDLHVHRNRLSNAIRWLQQIDALIQAREKRLVSIDASDETLGITKYDFQKRIADFRETLHDLEEREAFLRIFRIHDTIDKDLPAISEKEKFTFAYFLEADVLFLESFFKQFDGIKFKRDDLNDESILTEVSEEALGIRQKYQDKIEKGKLLFLGLHWWFRGRYGAGPLAKGLLKAQGANGPGAPINEKELFPLAMPTAAPQPLDPYKNEYRVPHYERRHHYTWQMQQEGIYKYARSPVSEYKNERVGVPDNAPKYKKFY